MSCHASKTRASTPASKLERSAPHLPFRGRWTEPLSAFEIRLVMKSIEHPRILATARELVPRVADYLEQLLAAFIASADLEAARQENGAGGGHNTRSRNCL